MKVFVAGATGAIGQRLVPLLDARGARQVAGAARGLAHSVPGIAADRQENHPYLRAARLRASVASDSVGEPYTLR